MLNIEDSSIRLPDNINFENYIDFSLSKYLSYLYLYNEHNKTKEKFSIYLNNEQIALLNYREELENAKEKGELHPLNIKNDLKFCGNVNIYFPIEKVKAISKKIQRKKMREEKKRNLELENQKLQQNYAMMPNLQFNFYNQMNFPKKAITPKKIVEPIVIDDVEEQKNDNTNVIQSESKEINTENIEKTEKKPTKEQILLENVKYQGILIYLNKRLLFRYEKKQFGLLYNYFLQLIKDFKIENYIFSLEKCLKNENFQIKRNFLFKNIGIIDLYSDKFKENLTKIGLENLNQQTMLLFFIKMAIGDELNLLEKDISEEKKGKRIDSISNSEFPIKKIIKKF